MLTRRGFIAVAIATGVGAVALGEDAFAEPTPDVAAPTTNPSITVKSADRTSGFTKTLTIRTTQFGRCVHIGNKVVPASNCEVIRTGQRYEIPGLYPFGTFFPSEEELLRQVAKHDGTLFMLA